MSRAVWFVHRGVRRASVCVSVVALLCFGPFAPVVAGQEPPSSPAVPLTASGAWTLERVVTAALAQHPVVDAAQARVEAARAERLNVGALPNPVGTFWMENTGFAGQQVQGLNREASMYVTWPLEPLIQRSSRIRRADEDVGIGEASLALARRRVAADAVRAFLRVALSQEVAEEADHELGMLEQLATYNRARVDEGITPEAELLRIQVELDRAATDVAFAEADLTRHVAELVPYLGAARGGLGGPAEIRVVVPSAAVPAVSSIPSLSVVLARAHDRRPELLAGRARVEAMSAAESYERTLTIRQLGATIGNKRVDGQNSMVLGVSLAVPLFNRNRGGVERARSERAAAEHDLAWTDRSVAADLDGAYGAATRLTRQLGDLQQSFLARAEELYQLTLGAYQESGATLLQVLDATRTLADARLTYSRALFAQRQSLFDLALATGAQPEEAVDLLRTWTNSSSVTAQGGGAP